MGANEESQNKIAPQDAHCHSTASGANMHRALRFFSVAIIVLPCALSGADGAFAQSASIPDLNVDPVCRGIAQQAANPSEQGDPDLAFAQCVKSEQAMRLKLISEWSTFTPGERSACIANETSAQLPSYTDLVTCVEMAKAARKLNQ